MVWTELEFRKSFFRFHCGKWIEEEWDWRQREELGGIRKMGNHSSWKILATVGMKSTVWGRGLKEPQDRKNWWPHSDLCWFLLHLPWSMDRSSMFIPNSFCLYADFLGCIAQEFHLITSKQIAMKMCWFVFLLPLFMVNSEKNYGMDITTGVFQKRFYSNNCCSFFLGFLYIHLNFLLLKQFIYTK